MKYRTAAAFTLLIAGLVTTLSAQPGARQERVQLPAGKNQVILRGTLKGDEMVDYILPSKAGEAWVIALDTRNASTNFNVTGPGAQEALFIGSTSGSKFEGKLPTAGDYTVRVYLMRSAARRGSKTAYTITFRK